METNEIDLLRKQIDECKNFADFAPKYAARKKGDASSEWTLLESREELSNYTRSKLDEFDVVSVSDIM